MADPGHRQAHCWGDYVLLSHAIGSEGKQFSSTSELSFQTQLSSHVSEQSHG